MIKKTICSLHCYVLTFMIVLSALIPVFQTAEAQTWADTSYDEENYKQIRASKDYFWGKIKQSDGNYWAFGIKKGTLLGTIYQSTYASKTTSKISNTYYRKNYYGDVYGNAYDILITMKPVASLRAYNYISSN